jgi:Zn-dependent protease
VFFEPNRSPYDWNFKLFGIDVRVHPMFWLFSIIFGWNTLEDGFPYLVAWVVCVFISVLIHEMGHVFMGRLFGSHGHIVLYSFGGLAIGSSALRNRWQRIAVYFAGPLAGFLLYGLVWWSAARHMDAAWWKAHLIAEDKRNLLLGSAVSYLVGINLYWGILNLLPIWPLDGGQISRDLFDGLVPETGIRVSLGISIVVAGLLAFITLINTYSAQRPAFVQMIPYLRLLYGGYLVLLFASLAFNSYQMLQIEGRRRPWDREPDYWDND